MSQRNCSKCSVRPAANKHPWCRECKAENQAENRAAKDKLAEGHGFSAGVDAMREMLALEFTRLGVVSVSCLEVAQAIRRAPRPVLKA